jgi:hypothetical protein
MSIVQQYWLDSLVLSTGSTVKCRRTDPQWQVWTAGPDHGPFAFRHQVTRRATIGNAAAIRRRIFAVIGITGIKDRDQTEGISRIVPKPHLQVWTSFSVETHQQVARLWIESPRRQMCVSGSAKTDEALD